MAKIIVGGGVNANNATPGMQNPNQITQPGGSAGKKLGKFLSDYYKIPISIAIALGFYLLIRSIIPSEHIVWWGIEGFALILSLLVLAGVSTATKTKLNIGTSVFLFLISMFLFFIIRGYNNHPEEDGSAMASKTEILIPVLGPGTHTFFLKEVGDETGAFQFPEGGIYDYQISSGDYGYEIIFMDDPTNSFSGDPSLVLPKKEHAVINIIATKANQYVRVSVK